MAYTVGRVAELAAVSIRTLHHYDEIGLLRPAAVSEAGYRLYAEADLERLQQILFFKELGFALPEIKAILDDPAFDRRTALRQHREALLERQGRLVLLIRSIDNTLEAMERGIQMPAKDLFDGFDHAQYEEEARQRWGNSKEYQESAKRTGGYTKADWEAIKAEGMAIYTDLASVMDRDPADPAVQAAIQRHHQQINDRFYTCSTAVYRGLGEMYVQDERFTANIDKVKPGLARFMNQAMQVYCDRLEGKR